jgi:hypothetical protein
MGKKGFIVSCMMSLLLAVPFVTNGQGKREREYSGFFDSYYYRGPLSYTLSAGMAAANGDMGKVYESPLLRPAFGIGANYRLWPRTVFGAEFSYFMLGGKSSVPGYTLSFNSVNMELDLYGRLYIVDDITRVAVDRRKKPKMFKPYLMSGIGIMRYNSVPSLSIDTLLLDSLTIQGVSVPSSGFTPVVPVGLGLSIFITHRVSVITELAYRFAFTDLMDGTIFLNDGSRDGYASFSLKLQYSPTAPKRKKRMAIKSAPEQYNGPKGTDTWKNKKPEQKKYDDGGIEPLPGETPPGETPPGETQPQETPPGDTPTEETPQQNNDQKIENQLEEPAK